MFPRLSSWVSGHFLHPFMLLGIALILIPILIWLFSRVRFRVVEWAAQTFLLRAFKKSQRRLKIENILLLIIRCLVIGAFVMALARPRGQAIVADTTDARKNVVIVMDTSYSTGYQVGSDAQQTVHEREKLAAKEIVRNLHDTDRLALIAFDEQARKIYPAPRAMVAKTQKDILDDFENLPELQRGSRGTDYAAAFHLLPEVLRRFDMGPDGQPPLPDAPPSPKIVFLLSDMQRSGLVRQGGLKDGTIRGVVEDMRKLGATVQLVDCGAEDPKNAGVLSLETREPIVGANLPCYIECTVRNFGLSAAAGKKSGEALGGLTLEYFIDGSDTPVKFVSLDLQPEESRQLEPLRYVFHEKGPHRVTVRLKSDALQVDNERSLIVDVREAVKVLLVDGEPRPDKWESETDFLRKALDPFGDGKDLIRPEVIQEAALPVGGLGEYDVIVLANVVSLPGDHVTALEQFVREGKAVIFTMGNLVDARHYNEKLWRRGTGLFPCELGEIKGTALSERAGDRDASASEWIFALADPEHPALRLFAEEDMKPHLKGPSIFRYFSAQNVSIAAETSASVPLRLVPRPKEENEREDPTAAQSGAPVLVEKPFGRGRVSAYLTTVDFAWSTALAYDTFYVPFWRQMVLELARTSRPKRNLAIGDRYERIIGTSEYAPSASVEVLTPEGNKETFRPENIEGREQFRISYPPSPETRVEAGGTHDGNARREEAAGVDKPGIYDVKLIGVGGDAIPLAPDYFAVRLDATEGDVSKLELEDWKELLPGLEPVRAVPDSVAEDAFRKGSVGGNQGDELWPLAIAACLALLVLESVLAALFGRRRQ